jgi:lipopolysaccharide transport system permease protein
MMRFRLPQRIDLLISLTRRDIDRRYKESVVGAAWGIVVPLIMLGIYTVIFSTIFQARWGDMKVVGKADYAVILFIGLIVFGIFAEAVTRAPTAILSQPNLVKKVKFPLELLPLVVVLSCLYNAAVASVGFCAFLAYSSFGLHWEMLALPVLLIPFVALVVGVTFLLSSLGVFLRDVDQIAALLARVLQYLTPVLYPSSIFPSPIGELMRASPLAMQVEQIRALVIFGQWPDWGSYAISSLVSLLILAFGWFWFRKTQRAFADVL